MTRSRLLLYRRSSLFLTPIALFSLFLLGCGSKESLPPSGMVSASSFTELSSRKTQGLIKRIQELTSLSREEKSGIQYSGGLLILEDNPKIPAPRIVIQKESNQEIFLDFQPVFSLLPGAHLRGIRFSYDSKNTKTLGFVESTAGQFLLLQDQLRSEPKIYKIQNPIDYRLMEDGRIATLLRDDKGLFVRILSDHPEFSSQMSESDYPLPPNCLHASFAESKGIRLLIECVTAQGKEWLWWSEKLLPIANHSLQGASDIAITQNSVYVLFSGRGSGKRKPSRQVSSLGKSTLRQYSFQDSEASWVFHRGSLSPTPLTEREIDGFATELTLTPSGTFVRTRSEFFFHYLFLPAKAKPSDPVFRISRAECSLTLIPFIGDITSHEFRCETPVAIHGRSCFSPVAPDKPCQEEPEVKSARLSKELTPAFITQYAKSADGTDIPYSILTHREPSSKDQILVHVYGSYGQLLEPTFDPLSALFFEQGGNVAYAHTRGGGYYGEAWHDGGRGPNKGTVVQDLYTVVRELKREKPPVSIFIRGKSAGAWPAVNMLGRNEAPHKILVEMPVVSPLKQISPTDPYLKKETYEWGAPADPEAMKLYQAFETKLLSTRRTTRMPILYVRIAEHDERVQAEPIVEWLSKVCESISPCIVEHSKNAGHLGALNFYDELRSLGMQARFLLTDPA